MTSGCWGQFYFPHTGLSGLGCACIPSALHPVLGFGHLVQDTHRGESEFFSCIQTLQTLTAEEGQSDGGTQQGEVSVSQAPRALSMNLTLGKTLENWVRAWPTGPPRIVTGKLSSSQS